MYIFHIFLIIFIILLDLVEQWIIFNLFIFVMLLIKIFYHHLCIVFNLCVDVQFLYDIYHAKRIEDMIILLIYASLDDLV